MQSLERCLVQEGADHAEPEGDGQVLDLSAGLKDMRVCTVCATSGLTLLV